MLWPWPMRSPQDRELHHRITWNWLHAGGQLRTELEQLVAGTSLHSLPHLHRHVAELMFIPVSERIIEAEQSLVHRETHYRHVSGAYVSIRRRAPEIHAALKEDPVAFLHRFEELADPAVMAAQLHLTRHPLWISYLGMSAEIKRRCVDLLLYTRSRDLQFASVGRAAEQRLAAHDRAEDARKRWVGSTTRNNSRMSVEAIETACMNDHLRQRLVPGMLCALPLVASTASMPPLQHSFAPAQQPNSEEHLRRLAMPLAATRSAHWGGAPGLDTDANMEDFPRIHPRLIFFRIVSASLGDAKVLSLPPASSGQLRKHDVCVTLHKACHFEDDDDAQALVNSEPDSASSMSSVVTLNAERMRDHITKMQVWKVKETVCAFQEGDVFLHEPEIKELLVSKALPSMGHTLDVGVAEVSKTSILYEMAGKGLVQCVAEDDVSTRWKLSALGVSRLYMLHLVHEPSLLFGNPIEDMALVDTASAWELLVTLKSHGWELTPAPKTTKQRMNLPPFVQGGLKWAFLTHKEPILSPLLQSCPPPLHI